MRMAGRFHPFFMNPLLRVIAHRGGSGLGTENSIRAMRASLAKGAGALEVDVQISRDGVPVLMHDPDLLRVAGIPAMIRDLSLADLKTVQLQPSGIDSPDNSTEPIPTLLEALTAFPETRFSLDLKFDDLPALDRLHAVIQEAHAEERVLLASFNAPLIHESRRKYPLIPTQATSREIAQAYLRSLLGLCLPKQIPYVALALPPQRFGVPLTTARFIRTMEQAGIYFTVWTINDPATMQSLFEKGCHAVITDHPDLVP